MFLFEVVIPGLHLILGIFLKIFNLFERECKRFDYLLENSTEEILGQMFHLEDYIASLEQGLATCTNTYNWQLINAINADELEAIESTYTNQSSRVESRILEKVVFPMFNINY